MDTKPTPSRSRIPSVSELLDNPPIRALADRWNRSAIAAGVRSFLDELRSDLGGRGDAVWPSVRELGERAARHVIALQQSSNRPAINATGRIWGAPWISRPQCESALERAFATGRDFIVEGKAAGESLSNDIEPAICRITGAGAAVAVHSYAGGLWLALAAVASGREVIISRAELGELEASCPLSRLIASAGAIVREIGATNRTTAADYEAAMTPQSGAILKVCPDNYRLAGQAASAELEELVALSRDRELALIDVLGISPLTDLPDSIPWRRRSMRASLSAGADVVVIRGDGLVGGPACGIIAGNRHAIERIKHAPLSAAWQLDAPRAAALIGTLQCCEHPSRSDIQPTLDLLTTPLENLRNRAERLAPQLAEVEGIAAAEAVEIASDWSSIATPEHVVTSFGVALQAANGDIDHLDRRLRAAQVPVFGRVEAGRLLLDLRTVFPRHDPMIVQALRGTPPTTVEAADDAVSAHA